MKIVVVGAGAIGGYVGALLASVGADVTLIARGAHLQAMERDGLRVRGAARELHVRPRVSSDLAAAADADVVFLGVKAHALTQLAPRLAPYLKDDATVVSMQNGIPWWYFQHAGPHQGLRLERVDPGGVIAAAIDPKRVVGSLAYFSTEIVAPGVIRHVEGDRIALGEPNGVRSERCRRIADALAGAGLRCPITTRIRHEIWVKLLGNASLNPISALTGATLVDIVRHPEASALLRTIMGECETVAARLGIELPISIEQRIAGAARVGAHRTSMLQDMEASRPTELDAIVGAVIELGERLGVPTPATRSVYACAKLLEELKRSAEAARAPSAHAR